MKKDRQPYLSLAFLTGLNLFNYLDRNVLPAVLTTLQKDLHLDDAQVGPREHDVHGGLFRHVAVFRLSRAIVFRASG